jgi:Mg2+ and Co2+ transporter CorA
VDHAVAFAAAVEAKTYAPFHYDPTHDDATRDAMLAEAAAALEGRCQVIPAREGDTVVVTPQGVLLPADPYPLVGAEGRRRAAAEEHMAHTRVYCKGVLEAEGFPVADVSDHLERPGTVIWVDLCGPSRDQLHELAEELGLHPLAVEDALEPHQRPKLDHYATHSFLSCHCVRVDTAAGRLDETEVDAFISPRWLITVRQDDEFDIDRVVQRWDRSPDLFVHGVGFLLYGLLDVIVDGYFDAVQSFDEYYDEVSEGIFAEPHPALAATALVPDPSVLIRFHRLVVPMRRR